MSADQPCRKLRVTESFQASSLQDGRRLFALNIDLDNGQGRHPNLYHDILSKEGHDKFHDRYALKSKEDLRGNADRIAEVVDNYRRSFSHKLALDRLLTSDTIQIDIEANYQDNVVVEDKTNIDGIPWELLEPSEESDDLPPAFTVRRVLPKSYNTSDMLQKEPTWHWNEQDGPVVNLLLVVARKVPIGIHEHYADCDPGIAQQILMRIQADLKKHDVEFDLNIAILYNPTFAELKIHLETVQHRHGKGFYDILHFDAHGVVKKGNASLQLSAGCFSDDLETVGALALRACIAEHGSKCVVFNSCDSARADRGQEANLSRALTQLGVPVVLGMSSSLSETAAAIFLKRFYEGILIKRWKVSQAATSGRIALGKTLERFHGTEGFHLADSNVPVCYTTEQEIQIPSPRDRSSSVNSQSFKNTLSLWCIPSKPTSPTDSRLRYTTNFPYLEEQYASMARDDGSMLYLNDDIMRFHRDLSLWQIVFLYGDLDMILTEFIRGLCKHWRSTRGFWTLRYIRAEEFLSNDLGQPPKKKDFLSLWKRIFSMHPRPEIGYREEQTGCSDLKQILIIDRIHLLNNDSLHPADITRGLANLESFLSRHPLALPSGVQTSNKEIDSRYYVIITGQKEGDWSKEILPSPDILPQFFSCRLEPRFFYLDEKPDDTNEADEVTEEPDDVINEPDHLEGSVEEEFL